MRPVPLTPEAVEAVNALERWRHHNGETGMSIQRLDGTQPLVASVKNGTLELRQGPRKSSFWIGDEKLVRRLALAINNLSLRGGQ